MSRVRYIRDLKNVDALTGETQKALGPVCERFRFRANDYYLSLIDWDDPRDPIRKIVIPEPGELEAFGALDVSDEESNYTVAGCQHKYPDTALLVCNEACGAYCRFCFRKRLFMDDSDEAVNDVSPGLEYIRSHPEITDVLLTGGDPMLMATRKLEAILEALRAIPHVRIIRIGSKMPAFNPYRITEDPELLEVLSRYSTADKRIYIMAHFNVSREITEVACESLARLQRAGVITANQTPILRGINAEPEVLAALSQRLSRIGVASYYFFQCRPTEGNKPYEIPLVQTYEIVSDARSRVSGLAKTARLVMSHALGKIEMVGLTDRHIYMRFHRARRAEDEGRFMIFHRDDDAYWLEDLVPVDDDSAPYSVQNLDRRVRASWEPE